LSALVSRFGNQVVRESLRGAHDVALGEPDHNERHDRASSRSWSY